MEGGKEKQEWTACPAPHGPYAYALRVVGDAMSAPHGPSYPPGCIIIVDPDQTPVPGDRILAALDGEPDAAFKILVRDGGKTFLKSLNPHYPPIFEEFRILGKVIGAWIE